MFLRERKRKNRERERKEIMSKINFRCTFVFERDIFLLQYRYPCLLCEREVGRERDM